ncbi:MAG: FMN-binding negative transcriptional regulator [Telluria sp.]
MYTPRHFEETRLDVLHALIASHPMGALVRHGAGGLDADHIPFEIAGPAEDAPFGTLRAHVARANPLWREAGAQVMVLFQSPTAYISPAFYEQKAVDGKVVPTWNYAVVHARGTLRAIDEPAWLLSLVERLTDRHEAVRAQPWKVADAPRDYIDKMLKAIVGIEIRIDRIEGKWKTSQNRSAADQSRIPAGLAAEGHPLGELMQAWQAKPSPR